MANQSIYDAFNRMWHYVVDKLGNCVNEAKRYTDTKISEITLVDKATSDASGNVITSTYATKTEAQGYANAKDEAIAAAQSAANSATLAVQQHKEAVDATLATVNTTVGVLVDQDANKSVRTIANEELAAQLLPESAKESLDTLEEIAAWIQTHPDDVANINAQLLAINNQLKNFESGEGVVKNYVDAIGARVTSLESKLNSTSLILIDAINGTSHTIQIQNGQLVSFPIES